MGCGDIRRVKFFTFVEFGVMAHEIEEVRMLDGRLATEAMFADGKPAWHGLGYTWAPGHVPNSMEVEEKMPSVFFEVEKEPIRLVNDRDGMAPPIDDNFALVRQDTGRCLHVVGGDYQVWQNREAFEFLDSLQQDGIMKYETVVVLKGGKTVVLLARLPGVDTITAGDHCFRYVLCSLSHGGGAIVLTPTSIRAVCWNTLQMALTGSRHKVSIRHSGDLKSKLDTAHKYISQFDSAFTHYREDAQKLLVGCTKEQRIEYINELFPISTASKTEGGKKMAETKQAKRVDQVRQTYLSKANQMAGVKDTWWGMFNALTESVDHGNRQERGKDARKNLENRFITITGGPMADFKTHAFNLALEMAG